jgi:hypothetical protein
MPAGRNERNSREASHEKMKAHQEKIEAKMEAWLENMEANQEKLEAMVQANQEKMEAMAKHCKWVPCVKATHLLTTLQGWASDVLHGVPNRAMYEETIGHVRTDLGTSTWPQHTALS